jgi:hypothetical protein
MTRKRKLLWASGSVAAAIVAFLLATGGGNLILLFIALFVQSALFPSTISWDSHEAAAKCPGAIATPSQWPQAPAAACEAMWMCANEAVLSDAQHRALYDSIHRTPGCQEP